MEPQAAKPPTSEKRFFSSNLLILLMARPKGFEPLTPRFVVWCSIQLSYGRAME